MTLKNSIKIWSCNTSQIEDGGVRFKCLSLLWFYFFPAPLSSVLVFFFTFHFSQLLVDFLAHSLLRARIRPISMVWKWKTGLIWTPMLALMHLSMLSRRGGRQGIGRGFDRHSWPVGRAFDRFSCPRGRIIWFFALRPWWGCFCHMVGRDWYPVDCSRFAHVM